MNINNSSSLVFRYPSPNMKPIKQDPSNDHKKTMANNNSFTKFSSQITHSTQIKQNSENNQNIATKNCENLDKSLNKSQITSMNTSYANKENNNKFLQLFEKLNFENNHLKEKLADLEKKIENPKLFKNTDNILDFRGFIKAVNIYTLYLVFHCFLFRISKNIMNC